NGVENGTDDTGNPLWVRAEKARQKVLKALAGTNVELGELVRGGGIIGDGRTGKPIAFTVPRASSPGCHVWRVDPRWVEASDISEIASSMVGWICKAAGQGKLA